MLAVFFRHKAIGLILFRRQFRPALLKALEQDFTGGWIGGGRNVVHVTKA